MRNYLHVLVPMDRFGTCVTVGLSIESGKILFRALPDGKSPAEPAALDAIAMIRDQLQAEKIGYRVMDRQTDSGPRRADALLINCAGEITEPAIA